MPVTTLQPGLVYASATVVKVCLAASIILAIAPLVRSGARSSDPTPAAGALVGLTAQGMTNIRSGAASSRYGVLAMLAMIGLVAISAVYSLHRRERPGVVAVIGLIMSISLVTLFWWL
jgi:hypothetical protein